MDRLCELRNAGKIEWIKEMGAWAGQLDDVVRALAAEGFEECRKEVIRSRHEGQTAGGLWQGLHQRTGVVASAVWFNGGRARQSIVFVDVDGEPLTAECDVS